MRLTLCRGRSEKVEQVVGDPTGEEPPGLIAAGESDIHLAVGGELAERAAVLPELEYFGIGELPAIAPPARRGGHHARQPIRLAEGQGIDQVAVDESINGGVGPDPEGQAEQGGQGEQGIAQERPERETRVLTDSLP